MVAHKGYNLCSLPKLFLKEVDYVAKYEIRRSNVIMCVQSEATVEKNFERFIAIRHQITN